MLGVDKIEIIDDSNLKLSEGKLEVNRIISLDGLNYYGCKINPYSSSGSCPDKSITVKKKSACKIKLTCTSIKEIKISTESAEANFSIYVNTREVEKSKSGISVEVIDDEPTEICLINGSANESTITIQHTCNCSSQKCVCIDYEIRDYKYNESSKRDFIYTPMSEDIVRYVRSNKVLYVYNLTDSKNGKIKIQNINEAIAEPINWTFKDVYIDEINANTNNIIIKKFGEPAKILKFEENEISVDKLNLNIESPDSVHINGNNSIVKINNNTIYVKGWYESDKTEPNATEPTYLFNKIFKDEGDKHGGGGSKEYRKNKTLIIDGIISLQFTNGIDNNENVTFDFSVLVKFDADGNYNHNSSNTLWYGHVGCNGEHKLAIENEAIIIGLYHKNDHQQNTQYFKVYSNTSSNSLDAFKGILKYIIIDNYTII